MVLIGITELASMEAYILLGDEKMGKDDVKSTFDFDTDPEFNENFYKNIENALGDSNAEIMESTKDNGKKAEVIADYTENTTGNEEFEIVNATGYKSKVHSGEESAALEQNPVKAISEEEIEDKLVDINAALAKQICEEMNIIGTEAAINEKKKKRSLKIQSGIILTLLCLVGFGFFFGFTKPGNQLLMKMGVDLSGKIWATWTDEFDDNTELAPDQDFLDEEDLNSDAQEVDPSQIVWPQHPGAGRKVEGVYNVLLMGEEAIGSGTGRGRTDVIIIATLNTNNKTVKLTSLMRDMLVQIPGYKDNKLNSAYEKGGIDLLYETIALNFNIRLDGSAKVNFENFEKIIDQLGGLEITLTAGEANYLNSTNYISNPEYRNVVEGRQHLNGNQVLGYSRVRKRATITGENNDYGRTDRHRIVLNAIFDKYKTKSKVELAAVMLQVLPMITTDIDSKNFELLLNTFIEMGTTEMSQLRIPADGTFTDNVKVRGMDVLIPDLTENVEILHTFIFGKKTVVTTDNTESAETTSTAVINNENSNDAGTTNNSN
jgi:LCP family protein required for cell wall assembly